MSDLIDSGGQFRFSKDLWDACQTHARRVAILRYVPSTVQIVTPADLGDGIMLVEHPGLTVEDRNTFLYLLENPEILDAIAEENADAPELA